VLSRRVASSERVGEGEGAGNRGKSSVDCAVPQRCVVLSGEDRYFAIARRRLAPFFENQVTQLRPRPSTQRLHHSHHSHHSQRRQHSRRVQNRVVSAHSCSCSCSCSPRPGCGERRASVRPTKQDRAGRAEQSRDQARSGQVRSGLRRLSR
jgi:hypothetical protein